MDSIFIALIVFGSIIIALAIIPLTVLIGIKMFRGRESRFSRGVVDKEAQTIQEIYQGLSRMEQRVEALEILLLEKERKDV